MYILEYAIIFVIKLCLTIDSNIMITVGKENFYLLSEAAALLQMHPNTLTSHIRAGKMKGKKLGKKWVIAEEFIKEYLTK